MPKPQNFGWVPFEDRTYGVNKTVDAIMQDMPLLSREGTAIMGTGAGKKVLLYKALEAIYGGPAPYNMQGQLGSCVGVSWSRVIGILSAVEIKVNGESEDWPGALICPEWIYGTSRVLVGQRRLGNGDGSVGAWMAQAVKDHGTLRQLVYGQYDLTKYSVQRCKSWGYRGLPVDELEPPADEHPVRQAALVTSYEQGRDAIANGYPVAYCGNVGFNGVTRDADGFIKQNGLWSHCMGFVACNDTSRPGLLLDNSTWGNWLNGPVTDDNIPVGTAWVDAELCDKMLKQGDSFAIAQYAGFPAKAPDWDLW